MDLSFSESHMRPLRALPLAGPCCTQAQKLLQSISSQIFVSICHPCRPCLDVSWRRWHSRGPAMYCTQACQSSAGNQGTILLTCLIMHQHESLMTHLTSVSFQVRKLQALHAPLKSHVLQCFAHALKNDLDSALTDTLQLLLMPENPFLAGCALLSQIVVIS